VYVTARFAYYTALMHLFIFFYFLDAKEFTYKKKYLLLLIPGLLSVLLVLLFGDYPGMRVIAPEKYYEYLYRNVFINRVTSAGSAVVAFFYISILCVKYIKIYLKTPKKQRDNIAMLIVVQGVALVLLITFLDYYFVWGYLKAFFKMRFSLFVVLLFLSSYRYPHILNLIKLEAYRDYYFRTQTKNLDLEKIIGDLNTLVSDIRLLSDSSLNLKKTADLLHISTHQLSEVLNTHLKKAFPAWLNEVRVKKAREMLISFPEKKILEIAMETGFNSISVFNVAFKKQIGVPPSVYRKKYGR
jgi:AraC-like DNA-binding protein